MKQPRQKTIITGLIGLTAIGAMGTISSYLAGSEANAASAPVCETAEPQRRGNQKIFEVGKIWSGVRTMIGAAEPIRGQLWVAYYDADRWVTLASVDAGNGRVCRTRLKSRFTGWDGHNNLTMAVAPDGSIHMAGNAHATPLFYARTQGRKMATLRETPLIGRDEDVATYPTFLKDARGRLVFLYRSGGSGDGRWIANRWAKGRWRRLGSAFSDVDRTGSHLSAYPSPFMADRNGVNHVAIVWRRTPDVATNFAVGYARTADFQLWSGTKGPVLMGPVRPDQIDIVDQPGEKSGLLNSAKLLMSADGKPVIFYTRYGSRRTDTLLAARQTATGWDIKEIATSDHRTPIEGEGSLPGAPTFSASPSGNIANVSVAFPKEPSRSFQLDLTTLSVVKPSAASPVAATAPASQVEKALLSAPSGLANASVRSQPVTASGFDGHWTSRLIWYAQSLNRDRAWTCTPQFPQACTPPPSPLLWAVPSSAEAPRR